MKLELFYARVLLYLHVCIILFRTWSERNALK